MRRRSFVKQSVSAAILTPLAFSGLINAAGATEGGTENTTVPETTWFTTFEDTVTTDTTILNQRCDAISGPYYTLDANGNGICWWETQHCGESGSGNMHGFKPCPVFGPEAPNRTPEEAAIAWAEYLVCASHTSRTIDLPLCPFGWGPFIQ